MYSNTTAQYTYGLPTIVHYRLHDEFITVMNQTHALKARSRVIATEAVFEKAPHSFLLSSSFFLSFFLYYYYYYIHNFNYYLFIYLWIYLYIYLFIYLFIYF